MGRRLHIVLLLMVVWLGTVPSFSQSIKVGLRGGVDVTSMDFNSSVLDKSNRTGFFVGPTLHIGTPLPFLSVDASVLYDQRTLKVADESLTQKTVLIPGNVRAGIHLLGMVGAFVSAGPQLAYNVGSASFYWEDLEGYRNHFTLQDTKLSLNLGGGVQVGSHLEAAFYYNIQLGKTADFTWDTLNTQLADQTMHRAKSATNVWSISLTYLF
ncbi:MAG: outer membrane beta-barrel protein [Prevotella sp.]|nr:outer membrane beta-barrel protein [Prevotella sp.]